MIYQKLSQDQIDRVMASIERHSKTKIGKKLKEMLYELSDDDLFVLGNLLTLKTDEQKQLLIDELSDGVLTDELTITEIAITIKQGNWTK